MTVREELTNQLIEQWQIVLPENFLDALTPDLWLRYGIEQGWVPEDLAELQAVWQAELDKLLGVRRGGIDEDSTS